MNNTRVSLSVNNVPLQRVLSDLELQIPFRFAFNSELIARQKNITLDVRNMKLDTVLNQILNQTSINYSIIGNQIVLQEVANPLRVTISGYVLDSITGEALPQAILYLPEKQMAAYANNYGFYSITLSRSDTIDLMISYIGFSGVHTTLAAMKNTSVNFYLSEKKTEINTIIIKKAQPDDNVKKVPPGKTDISMERVKTMPSIGGNGDILSTIQMMPGVLSGLDGRPGYFIRGGNTDQNLVQLDEATLYNPVHLLGMVSIFNSSAIKSAYLLKAGFPASFGDHLSSVLDITMREGNSQNFEGDFQIGTVTGGLTLTGPIMNNKGSFFISARRSTIDLILRPFEISNYYSDYNFYDVNAKLNFLVTKSDRVYLSFYQGRDNTAYSTDSSWVKTIRYGLHYGNQAAVLRWNHLFSQKLFANTSVVYNRYFHDVTARQRIYAAQLYSGIVDINYKTDFYFYPSEKHKISAGLNYLFQTQYPSAVTDIEYGSDSSLINPSQIPEKYARRFAAYFGDEFRISPVFSLYLGARMPVYITRGATYTRFEPRLSFMH
ncbi:MAG TPA: secretin and TonB N-terminal domain-containing protein, partial [Bacteroidales bacterium]|nr:secretin and TonB N-terminal domain-containing protein [Bacteroidales bacterium]